jgi:ParE toxin of type II toxin-antitoxin system, parDE
MAARKSAVKLTASFEANLASIEKFWVEFDTPKSYDNFLDVLLETVIRNLERFPVIGRSFLKRQARSVESQAMIERLIARIGDADIREYLIGDFLILYALIDDTVYLSSVRHHQQLSFDLDAFWSR